MIAAVAIGLLMLCTACKPVKPLQLQGVWQEESYWTPNDTIAADTLIRAYTLRYVTFDCYEGFTMELKTYHDAISGDPALGTENYSEYVKGTYKTVGKNINLKGRYYTDGGYTVIADSNNTLYSYGEYLLDGTFRLDNKRLILTPTYTDSTNNTSTTFAQIGDPFDCY